MCEEGREGASLAGRRGSEWPWIGERTIQSASPTRSLRSRASSPGRIRRGRPVRTRRRLTVVAAILAVAATAGILVALFPELIGRGTTEETGGPEFEDVVTASGIEFRHFDPATPRNYILETIGSGLGLDRLRRRRLARPVLRAGRAHPPRTSKRPAPTNKLYRNNGDGTFTDVTEAVGLARAGLGMGCRRRRLRQRRLRRPRRHLFRRRGAVPQEPDPTARAAGGSWT